MKEKVPGVKKKVFMENVSTSYCCGACSQSLRNSSFKFDPEKFLKLIVKS